MGTGRRVTINNNYKYEMIGRHDKTWNIAINNGNDIELTKDIDSH